MKYLIAGGAGFIGSNLVPKLLALGHHVTVVDNACTGSWNNLNSVSGHPSLVCRHRDVCTYTDSDVYHRIINLACPASPVAYQARPIETTLTSVLGTLNLLNIAKASKARFLQASTSEVYGDPTVHPQTEEYWGNVNSYGPRSCYDEGKRCAEALIYDYHNLHKVDTRIIRIFNTYGPKMDANDGRVVSNFINQALSNQDITIYGDGTQSRSFCYIDDLINGLLLVLEGNYDKPINVGNPGEYNMIELVEAVLEQIPESKSKVVFKPLPKDDPTQRCPDISKMKSMYNWTPTVSLIEGLSHTIKHFKKLYSYS